MTATPTWPRLANPRWGDAAHTFIMVDIVFAAGEASMPFAANPRDVEVSGREIYLRAVLGAYGPVVEFSPQVVG